MSLDSLTSGGGGNFESLPRLRYDAKAGRIHRSLPREQDPVTGKWVTKYAEIPLHTFKAVFDLENVEGGWMYFAEAAIPDMRLFPVDDDFGAQPSPQHKKGFRIMGKWGDTVGEFSSTALCVNATFSALVKEFRASKKAGTLPVVTIPETKVITTGSGTKKASNYQPLFQIVEWVARPADLVFIPKAGQHVPLPGPASTGATLVQAPGASDFG